MNAISPKGRRYRSIFLSDVHLGTPGCKAELLLDFLKKNESEYLYLVGDIIDVWRMKRAWYWRQAHNDVIQKLLRKARKGTRLYFIPGNHDENFRDFTPTRFGKMVVAEEVIHKTADGRNFLVLHGDKFDGVIKYAKWLAVAGDRAYSVMLALNTWFNVARRKLGFQYWSLSAYLKHKVKNAVEYISLFNKTVADETRRRGLDGVICGHIHHAEIREIDGITYCNDGDWVESCTALVEHFDGRFEIVYWADIVKKQIFPREQLEKECVSSSSQTLGFLRSMASFARLIP